MRVSRWSVKIFSSSLDLLVKSVQWHTLSTSHHCSEKWDREGVRVLTKPAGAQQCASFYLLYPNPASTTRPLQLATQPPTKRIPILARIQRAEGTLPPNRTRTHTYTPTTTTVTFLMFVTPVPEPQCVFLFVWFGEMEK